MLSAKGQRRPVRVLVVEDAARNRQMIMEALTNAGFAVNVVTEQSQARVALNAVARKFEAVIVEESLGEGRGLPLVRELRSKRVRLPVVVVTRHGNWRSYAEVMGLGAVAYLPHPVDPPRLIAALEEAVRPPRKKRRKTKQICGRIRR